MSITSVIERGVVVNTVEQVDTFGDIFDFIANHIDSWKENQVLWDIRRFDFESIDSRSIRSFLRTAASVSETRSGMKTAIFVDSDIGFGMMRMLQILAEANIPVELGVFRNKERAIAWLHG
ncbi:MAG: hypothetical protein QGG42_07885 [Phycisphaerae bacterium]|jgi:hypothetical protein|nr:hypothetical protein [Phycisphaerae bacterium]